MSTGPEPTLRLSVIDRLIQPADWEAGSSWVGSVEALKQSLVRDLEWLLNTRRISEPAPEAYREVQRSVYHFGLPDVSSRSADSPDALQALARDIEECIRLFEPRLADVRVTIHPAEEKGSRLARFVIEALLRMEPNPERVVFDTVLETASGKIFVNGGDGA
ncbi:MAG TPA: type VI secretion system baseplate subunit TssE [Longimicrobiaceae bacterium]